MASNFSLNTDSPYSFNEWREIFDAIETGQEPRQYSQYLNDWFNNKKSNTITSTQESSEKTRYKNLIRSLLITFQADPQIQQFATLDLDDERELVIALPFFARKLKEIAVYYRRQRDTIQDTKLKYSLIGSEGGLKTIVYDFVLNEYTKRNVYLNTLNSVEFQQLPELNDVFCNFDVQVKELWDETEFFC